MISPISGAAAVPQAAASSQPAAAPAPAQPATLANDTVSISAKGQQAAATGDVDHDGDSH